MKRFALFVLASLALSACLNGPTPTEPAAGRESVFRPTVTIPQDAAVRAVMALQDDITGELLQLPGVIGTATGMTEDGKLAIVVLTQSAVAVALLASEVDGVPLRVRDVGTYDEKKGLFKLKVKPVTPGPVSVRVTSNRGGTATKVVKVR